jgi:DNA-binding winged helix-turn-helix (wHTH) protein
VELHFGEFTLDPLTRQLRRGADEIHVSPKAFALLLELIERRPNALTKAALQESLWPGTLVVEANLSNLIAEIRRARRRCASSALHPHRSRVRLRVLRNGQR